MSSLSFSPDGAQLASACGHEINIWNVTEGREALTLRGHTDAATGVSWSPDGLRVASTGSDHSVRIWDPRTGEETLLIPSHASTVFCGVAWSPDSLRLARAGLEVVRIWDATSGYERDHSPRVLPYLDRQIAGGSATAEGDRIPVCDSGRARRVVSRRRRLGSRFNSTPRAGSRCLRPAGGIPEQTCRRRGRRKSSRLPLIPNRRHSTRILLAQARSGHRRPSHPTANCASTSRSLARIRLRDSSGCTPRSDNRSPRRFSHRAIWDSGSMAGWSMNRLAQQVRSNHYACL